ncbi:isochorismate synthase [Embleya scabrispora]|nr:isochorismate synthase [Embleya scabrispora]
MPLGPARFLLATSRSLLRAHPGPPLRVRPGPGQFARVAQTAERALRHAGPGRCVVGALPFDENTPAVLAVGRMYSTARTTVATCGAAPPRRAGPSAADPAYLAAVAEVVRRLRAGDARGVMLARSLTLAGRFDPTVTLDRLYRNNPGGHVFRLDLDPRAPGPDAHRPGVRGPRRILVGASPELLLSRHGDRLLLNPMGGSAPRHPDPALDRARAAELLGSAKERREHALLVDELRRVLSPLCTRLDIPERPDVVATARVWHLSTRIQARLRPPVPSALALAALLHPTPAVCGLPRAAARTLIDHLETHPRGYYSGLVGWMDRHGDGRWIIALRCAVIGRYGIRLWAGAGILPESDPEAELAETSAKFATMLDALGPLPVEHRLVPMPPRHA